MPGSTRGPVRLAPLARGAVAVLFPLALVLAGCDISVGHLAGRATDEWTRRYPLAPGGEVHIGNTNGRIEVVGVDGSEVEVRAERIARAATDAGARELLPRISITDEATPDRVSLETDRISGLLIGASFEVRYHVRAPKTASLDLTNTNGSVSVTGLSGKVLARTTNGSVAAHDVTGAVEARSTNGSVSVDLASLGRDLVSMQTTNGGITLSLPERAKADVRASWTNGGINISPDLKIAVTEQSRRKFEGRLNGGGTPIELHTTNGGIRVRVHDAAALPAEKPSVDERR